MASSDSSSSSTSTPGIKTFKKPFQDKAVANAKANVKKDKDDDEDKDKQVFERRLGGIKESLKELKRAVVVLKSAVASEWEDLDSHARDIESWVGDIEKNAAAAGTNFKLAHKSLEGHKVAVNKANDEAQKIARATAGGYHAQSLMDRLLNDVAANYIPQKVFDDLKQKFDAASAPTIKNSKDAQSLYVIFCMRPPPCSKSTARLAPSGYP